MYMFIFIHESNERVNLEGISIVYIKDDVFDILSNFFFNISLQ